MTHLTPEELRRWRDEGAEVDRQRVVTHLAECDACGARFAELVRTPSPGALPVRLRPEEFRPRGHRAFAHRQPGLMRWPALHPALAIAATLIVVAGIAALLAPDERSSNPVVRGTTASVVLQAPVGVVTDVSAVSFEWAGESTSGYRLRVFDLSAPATPLIDRDVTGLGYDPTQEERARLRPGGTYHWFVEYQTAAGTATVSPAATFAVSP
jgi:anti-sigma factor RsiW